jgi:VWFA-related protein
MSGKPTNRDLSLHASMKTANNARIGLNRLRSITRQITVARQNMRLRPALLPVIFIISFSLLIASNLMGQESQQPSPVIRSFVSDVLVPVVVRDARGHAVSNLMKDDFQVFDDGKLQKITGFTIIKGAAETSAANSSARIPDAIDSPAVSQPTSRPQRLVFLLFDDYNLTYTDLANAQQAAIRVLNSLAPSEIAAVLSISGTSSGLTHDLAKLKQAILDVRVKTLFQPEHQCPNVDSYQGDLIINKNDESALQAAMVDVQHCFPGIPVEAAENIARSAAQQALLLAENDYRSNLHFLRFILNGMATLPGQHVIILVSPGFLAPDSEAMTLQSEIMDLAARSNTVINALDARGLYTTNQGAEATVRVDQDTQRLDDRYRRESLAANADVMEELADGTGGTFYHNNNDLEAGFRTLISSPDCTYLLAFSAANSKPGAHHTLTVKVNEPGVTVQARRGYSTPAPEKHKK